MKKLLAATALLLLTACGAGAGTQGSAESLESVQTRAETGDKDAQFELGAAYFDGVSGVAKDLALAKQWFEKSAAQGDERAEFNLGVMHYAGTGVAQNYDTARSWFEKAAKQKNPRALFNLGVMYYRAEGVEQNYPQALEYFSEAGSQGFNEAQFNLGVMYAKGEGVTIDIGKAYAWFTAAKVYGNPRADEVIANIENGLAPAQLTEVKKLAAELKTMIDKNVADLKAKATASAGAK